MTKKVVLFAVGLVVFIAAFLVYQYLTGTGLGSTGPTTITPNQRLDKAVNNPTFEARKPDGTMEFLLTAKRSEPGAPGVYLLEKPRVIYYAANGQMVVVTADKCKLRVDTLGGDMTISKPIPKGAVLMGDVRMTIGPATTFKFDSNEMQPGQIQARMDQDVDLDYSQRLLTSPGKIEVRGERVFFDGRNVTVAFNTDQKRIEYLRIEEGNKIVVRQVGRQALNLTGQTDTKTAPSSKPAVVAGGPRSVYRLNFGKDVLAKVGQRELAAQTLALLFAFKPVEAPSADKTKQVELPGPTMPEPTMPGGMPLLAAPVTYVQQTKTSGRGTFGLMGNDDIRDEDLVLTWTGSMEMRPETAPDLLASDDDVALEAGGTAETPVTLQDGAGRWARALSLFYQTGTQTLRLRGDEKTPVRMADPQMGNLVCRGLDMTEAQGQVNLLGPGRIDVANGAMRRGAANAEAKTGNVVAIWQDRMVVSYENQTDPAQPKRTIQVARHIRLTGGASVQDGVAGLQGEVIDATLASVPGQNQGLEKLIATGKVRAYSGRNRAADSPADELVCNNLVINSTPRPGQLPLLSEVLAKGDVAATGHQFEAGQSAFKRRQSIRTQDMTVQLEPRGQTTGGGFNFNARTLVAVGTTTVDLSGYGPQPVAAQCDRLDADVVAGTAVLHSAAGANPEAWATIAQGNNSMTGQTLELTQKPQGARVPGPGWFMLAAGTKGDQPVRVNWAKDMVYDSIKQEVTFRGPIEAQLVGKADQESRMTCDNLLVKLAHDGAVTTDAQRMKLDSIYADGQVVATGRTLDPKDHRTVLTEMFFKGKTLNYSETTQVLDIPGKGEMLVVDSRPENPTAQASARGQTAFTWSDGLRYQSSDGTILLKKDVAMVHKPAKGMKLPNQDNPPEGDAALVKMKCQELTTTMQRGEKSATGNPMTLGAGGDMKIAKVTATTGAILEFNQALLSAGTLEFDAQHNRAEAIGTPTNPAAAVRPEGTVEADRIKWEIFQGNNGFTFVRPRGNIEVPGGN